VSLDLANLTPKFSIRALPALPRNSGGFFQVTFSCDSAAFYDRHLAFTYGALTPCGSDHATFSLDPFPSQPKPFTVSFELYLDAKLVPYPGLHNSGSYCYVTTALQLLFHIPAIRGAVLNSESAASPPAFCALKSLFEALLGGNADFRPDEFAHQMGVAEGEQCDVSEFLGRCFDLLERECPGIGSLYSGHYIVQGESQLYRLLPVPIQPLLFPDRLETATPANLPDLATFARMS
jgi:hypothetical protein